MKDLFEEVSSKLSRVSKYYGLRAPDNDDEAVFLQYAEGMRILSNMRRTVIFTIFLILYLLLLLAFIALGILEIPFYLSLIVIAGVILLLGFMTFGTNCYTEVKEAKYTATTKQLNKLRAFYTVFWIVYYVVITCCELVFEDWHLALAVWIPMMMMGFLVPVYNLQEGVVPMFFAGVAAIIAIAVGDLELKRSMITFPAFIIAIVITDVNHIERINSFYQEGKSMSESMASKRRLGNVFEQIYDIAFELDPVNRRCILLRNNEKYAVTSSRGIIPFDEFKVFVNDIVHPDDYVIAQKITDLDFIDNEFMVEGHRQLYFELRILDVEGEYTWVSAFFTKETKPDGYSDGSEYILCLIQNIQERKRNEDKLKLEAERDPLTQLYNKVTTRSLIEECLEKTPFAQHALIIIDIDNFKIINDTKGHVVGDQILVAFANELSRNFRETDILGRVGGDEFVVLIKNIQSIALVCDKLQRFTAAFKKYGIDHALPGRLSTSIGVAVFSKDGVTYEELFKKADAALYEAKRGGKDQYKFSITRS